MKRLLILLVVLVASVWLGLQVQRDPGYVLLAYQHWAIETSVWVALASLLVLCYTLYSLVKFLSKLSKTPGLFRRWKKKQRVLAAQKHTMRGLLALAEGQWQKAEKNLIRGSQYGDMPLISYLAAAWATQEQGQHLQRDEYIQQAFLANPDAQIAISLTQAQLQISHKQWEQALATLTSLLKQAPNHPYVYKLLKIVYLQLNDWENLLDLLPMLRKFQVAKQQELEQLETAAYQHKLANAKAFTYDELVIIWQKIPRQLRKQHDLIKPYVERLIKLNHIDEAVTLLQDALNKQLDNSLIHTYGLIKSSSSDKQLKVAETWLQQQPDNPELLLCLGRLCIYNQLWGKARTYLDASLAERRSPESCVELAKLLEKLDQKEEAIRYYREGLLASVNS